MRTLLMLLHSLVLLAWIAACDERDLNPAGDPSRNDDAGNTPVGDDEETCTDDASTGCDSGASGPASNQDGDDAGSQPAIYFDAGAPTCAPRSVGTRCETAGDCDPALQCKGDFAGERPICTKACTSDDDCPAGVCVTGIPRYSGSALEGRCMVTCQVNPDCACLGSVCDDAHGATERLCY
jgi:hypothetical protein